MARVRRPDRVEPRAHLINNTAVPEFHAEPYVYLAGLSHKSALIAWGAFYFKVRSDGRAKLVDDEDLQWVHPPRCESIGCRSAPYGPARVEVRLGAAAAPVDVADFDAVVVALGAPIYRYFVAPRRGASPFPEPAEES